MKETGQLGSRIGAGGASAGRSCLEFFPGMWI